MPDETPKQRRHSWTLAKWWVFLALAGSAITAYCSQNMEKQKAMSHKWFNVQTGSGTMVVSSANAVLAHVLAKECFPECVQRAAPATRAVAAAFVVELRNNGAPDAWAADEHVIALTFDDATRVADNFVSAGQPGSGTRRTARVYPVRVGRLAYGGESIYFTTKEYKGTDDDD